VYVIHTVSSMLSILNCTYGYIEDEEGPEVALAALAAAAAGYLHADSAFYAG
jgi:hypothetical protein